MWPVRARRRAALSIGVAGVVAVDLALLVERERAWARAWMPMVKEVDGLVFLVGLM